jgi:hypothetical protein
MKYLMIVCCVLMLGCNSSETSNIVDGADDAALAEYQAALAEADRMAAGDTDFKE